METIKKEDPGPDSKWQNPFTHTTEKEWFNPKNWDTTKKTEMLALPAPPILPSLPSPSAPPSHPVPLAPQALVPPILQQEQKSTFGIIKGNTLINIILVILILLFLKVFFS